MRKYAFSWDLIGNIDLARPNLGPMTRLEVYRLMQFTMRDVLEQLLGPEKVDEVFRKAGLMAGKEFFNQFLAGIKDFGEFTQKLQEVVQSLLIGILRLEESDIEKGTFTLTVSEDLDCSGLPETGDEVCVYDEGFIAGILESYVGKPFEVKEIDCWCTGDRTCRFIAKVME